jgi:hypothetical protein
MNVMSNPVQDPNDADSSARSKASIAQTVVGWVLVLVGGLFAIITLFTFPFVLSEQGKEAVIEAIYFVVPEVIALIVGTWLIRRNRRAGSGSSRSEHE